MNLRIQDGVLLSAELTENETALVVPEGVTALGRASLALKRQLRKVALPSTLIQIGPAAFSGCAALEELTLYEWVQVGSDAFGRCDALCRLELFHREISPEDTGGAFLSYIPHLPNLRKAVLHEGVSELGDSAFSGCVRLERAILPSTLRKIGSDAFRGCRTLKRVDLPESLDEIWGNAFSDCSSLQSVSMPHVQIISSQAFFGCTALERVDLPDSLIRIGGKAFAGCSRLKSVTVPPHVTRMDGDVFQDCAALESLILPPEIRVNGPIPGCPLLQTAACTDGTKMLVNWSSPDFAFPSGVTRIADSLFARNQSLRSAVWSGDVPVVPCRTFAGCENLKEVTLPDGVTTIEAQAFAYAWLERLALPQTLKTIGPEAFFGCRNLRPVIPASVERMGEKAIVGLPEVTFLGDLNDIAPLRPQIWVFPKLIRGHAGTNIEKLALESGAEFEEIRTTRKDKEDTPNEADHR